MANVDRGKDSYLGIKTFFLRTDGQAVDRMLGLPTFDTAHDAAATAALVRDVLKRWGLKEQMVKYLVTDNTSTMKAMARDHFPSWLRIPCGSHWLQLTVRDCLGLNDNKSLSPLSIMEAIKKVRNGSSFFSRSAVGLAQLLAAQQGQAAEMGQPVRPRLDQETRWNSTYDMILRFIRLREALHKYVGAQKEDPKWALSKDEWRVVEQTVALLKPFADITDDLQADKVKKRSFPLPSFSIHPACNQLHFLSDGEG